MLITRRVKHRKQHRPNRVGMASGGTQVTFGDFGIQALEPAYVTNRQIESARIAINRHIKRGGKVWIYKGDKVGTLAEQRVAEAAAAQRSARGDTRGGRPDDRAERPARRRSGSSGTTPTSTDAGRAAVEDNPEAIATNPETTGV